MQTNLSVNREPARQDDRWAVFILVLIYRVFFSAIGALVVRTGDPVSAWVGHPIFETHWVTAPDWGEWGRLFINSWYRWDTGYFLKIAAFGYAPGDGTIIFPPGYPLLIRLLTILTHNALLSGLIITTAACFVTYLLLFEFGKVELRDQKKALNLVILFLVFPSAFFLLAAYSESVFLAFALGAVLLGRKKKWWWAGFLGALAAATRIQGWILSLVLLFMWWADLTGTADFPPFEQIRQLISRKFGLDKLGAGLRSLNWVPLLFPIATYAAYLLWLDYKGLGSVVETYESVWGMAVVMPWEGISLFLGRLAKGGLLFVDYVDLVLFVLFLFLSIIGVKTIRLEYSIYLWASIGLMTMRAYDAQLIAGFSRYMLSLFPAFLTLIIITDRSANRIIRLILSTVFLILQLVLVLLFLSWYWVA